MDEKAVKDPSIKWTTDLWLSSYEQDIGLGFLEVPFDYAVSHRPGARFGPAGILRALSTFGSTNLDRRQSLEAVGAFHFGTVSPNHDFKKSYSAIQDSANKIPSAWTMIALGGDHSITDPLLRGRLEKVKNKKVGLIMFDAHLDCRPPLVGQEHSGHWVYTASDIIDFNNMIVLGMSSPLYSLNYIQNLESKGALLRTPSEIRQNIQHTWDEICAKLCNVDYVYITVDIDCIDQAFAPGTSVPATNGLFPHEVGEFLYRIAKRFPVIGFDLTEVSPPLDHDMKTQTVAATLIHQFWAGAAARYESQGYKKIDFNS